MKVLAAQHGRSAEAEIRDILANAVKPQGRRAKLSDEDFAIIKQVRDKTPAKPMEQG